MFVNHTDLWDGVDSKIQKRILLEEQIVKKVIKAFLKDGCLISIDHGEKGRFFTVKRSKDFKEIMNGLGDVDEERIWIYKKPTDVISNYRNIGYVYFVYGNAYDVISDYSNNLDNVLKPVNDWLDKKYLKTQQRS